MTYDKINLMIPSYKRLDMLKTAIESACATAAHIENLVFTVLLNEKDCSNYDMSNTPAPTFILKENLDVPNLSAYFNQMYDQTAFKGENVLVSMLGDDMEFKTQGWDTRVIDTINAHNGIGIVHCNDDFCSFGACPVNMFTTRKFVNACMDSDSIFMTPQFRRYFMDEIWGKVADLLECNYYLPDVIIKHNHTSGKSSSDETYNRLQRIGEREMAGGMDIARSYIWPYVERMVENFLDSDLTTERKI